ncbi:unnamed protein product [Clonostachys rosea]|uniref:Transcription factor domain-containing protein n=1 Tax=Bionectria ochroleuca TaxID=29856 RepID=A0ABY6UHG9_BIOOC|nr:unnamed protein product [Clonostachys rosea]
MQDQPARSTCLLQGEGDFAIESSENPVRLIAGTSNLQVLSTEGDLPLASTDYSEAEHSEIQELFEPTLVNLDIGDDIDPINKGLVTEAEAEELFDYFHKNLAHTRWGLDSEILTLSFARSRSAFLSTSIMAASALFQPEGATLSKRLSSHCKSLAHRIIVQRHKSVEIILAFIINIPWMFPSGRSTDDEACWYISTALSISIDLSVRKVLATEQMAGSMTGDDVLDPLTAMNIDGFSHIEAASAMGRRLLRQRERCWISLFVLERGISLARGRYFIVPLTRSITQCDDWHMSEIAGPFDARIVSIAVLRRDLEGIFAVVRAMCDGSRTHFYDGSLVSQSIQGAIERFFSQWDDTWSPSIRIGLGRDLQPYINMLITQTRLSIYSGVINHPTAPAEVQQFFRKASMSSDLAVMRVAVQGEAFMHSMPNNTALMITFAARFALTLSTYIGSNSNLAPSVIALIKETSEVLERLENVTKHRNGVSSLYGKYLNAIGRRLPDGSCGNLGAGSLIAPMDLLVDPGIHPSSHTGLVEQQSWSGSAFQFSTMSDQEVADILNQPRNMLSPSIHRLLWENSSSL